MVKKPELLSHPAVKILPHVIDTVLLTSAIALTFIVDQYPFYDPWLTAKVVALIIYILLGVLMFRWAQTGVIKIIIWLVAMLIFFYIVSVALTKAPLWFLY